jgi:hypothetical protein
MERSLNRNLTISSRPRLETRGYLKVSQILPLRMRWARSHYKAGWPSGGEQARQTGQVKENRFDL